MSDQRLPAGYTLVPPDEQLAVPPRESTLSIAPEQGPNLPGGTPSPAAPQAASSVPPGYTVVPPGGAEPQQPWKASILPFSSDASGKIGFDPNAGILGSALDAFKLPYDVYSGKQPVYGAAGSVDPSLVDRTLNLAEFISPRGIQDPSTGAVPPGSFARRAGPSGEDLKAATDAGYAAARASPATIPASTVATAAQAAQQDLQNKFALIPKTAPKTFDVLDQLANPPQGAQANYTGLEAARRELNAIKTSPSMGDSDPFAARQAISHLDNLIDMVSPDAATARANAAAGFRANAITGDLSQANVGILEKADTAAALRQRVKTFLQNPDNLAGFSPEEIAALNTFAKSPGVLSTLLTKTGDLLSRAGTAGAFIGSSVAGPIGAAVLAGGLPIAGGALKGAANQRASNTLDAIGQMLRSRSPLGESYTNQNLRMPSGLLNQVALPAALPIPQQSQPAPAPPGPPGRFPPLPATGPIPQGLLGPWA